MKVARWSYVKEPVFPLQSGPPSLEHNPSMCAKIVQVVRENPGLTGRDISAHIGKRCEYVVPLLWHLMKHTGALRTEVVGYVRTPGLQEFERVQCVQRMLSKLVASLRRYGD